MSSPREKTQEPTESAVRAAVSRVREAIAPRVFYPSALIILAFILVGTLWQTETPADGETKETDFSVVLDRVNTWITEKLGWYYILVVFAFVVFTLVVGLSRFGGIRLGPDDSKPEFSRMSWFAMLFSAGMGIGLVFWGAAEPLAHYATPPYAEPETEQAARDAMHASFMHWGVHAWAIYVVVGLALAYAVHRKGRPLSLRWALEPLLGRHVRGWLGDLIDVTAVVSTLFGVATSLGLGAQQVNAGLDYLGLVSTPESSTQTNFAQIAIIAVITSIALWSVLTGVKKGIKWLSNINIVAAAVLLTSVFIVGPTLFELRELFTTVGYYLQNILRTSLDAGAYPAEQSGYPEEGGFQAAWTAFYWGWWISWAPFVGVFIARISKGRTVREFCLGVLLVPTAISFVWFAFMGGTALHQAMEGADILGLDEASALFAMLDGLPASQLLAGLATLLVVTFFVTSSDSGSLVIDTLASGGNLEPPKPTRAFWALAEGAVAITLLVVGGIAALQTVSIVTALPFSIIMIGICAATWKALSKEHRALSRGSKRRREKANVSAES
ncbi:BCCT family transporter [Glycomyces sp. L485]|uniref:BCCT family transporter n=1 Tax=Glycomyces sp. L485 TaxID=2909235 RepID=UPI001F4A8173|nr:BCCT family transporter [Glycomyces sp. L485]MCH7232727.1 BCCT family transporter [Glycomyces sp. L485]